MNTRHHPATVSERPGAPDESEVRLQGAWLILARIAWLAASVLAVGLFIASIPSYFAFLHVPVASSFSAPQLTPGDVAILRRFGLSLDLYAWLGTSVYLVILLAYVLVGIVLFWRKPDDRMALLASLSLVLFPIAFGSSVLGTLPPAWTLPAEIVELLGNICMSFFVSLFPSGRFVPRWSRWLVPVWISYWILSNLFPNSPITNSWPFFFLFPGEVILLIAWQVYRYRRVSTPVQRQQTKWVVAGFAFAFGPLVIGFSLDFTLLTQLFPKSSLVTSVVLWPFDLLLLLFPISIAFAILRNRLWDIDALINRTLVYGLLTVLLAALYAGLVIGLESLVGLITPRSSQQPVVLVISTLAIVTLFRPLRRRIQSIIDRRFYRRKYDAAKILAAFTAALRNEVDLDQLRVQMLAVVQETMQPESASLWVRPQKHPATRQISWRAAASLPSDDEAREEQ